jgi:hypothetical protein
MVHYLQDRFGTLAFHDDSFHWIPEAERWTRTSPQHINVEALNRIFPKGFFDETFAVVRHPVSRLISAYHFQLEVEKRITSKTSFGDWLISLKALKEANPYMLDNHTRPMDEIVPQNAKVFYLEDGFDDFIEWLDQTTGTSDGPRTMGSVNKRETNGAGKSRKIEPTQEEIALITKLYAHDFERFGYRPEQPAQAGHSKASTETVAKRGIGVKKFLKSLGLHTRIRKFVRARR